MTHGLDKIQNWATFVHLHSLFGRCGTVGATNKRDGSVLKVIQETGKWISLPFISSFATTIYPSILFTSTALQQCIFFFFLQYSWVSQGQRGRCKRRGEVSPLVMLPLSVQGRDNDVCAHQHTNFCHIHKQREEWLKGETKMWDVFPDDMGFENSARACYF